MELEPLSSNEFKYANIDARVRFLRDSLNNVNRLKHFQHGSTYNAFKVEPFDPESVDLSEYTGRYYSEELTTSYLFLIQEGQLIARHQRHSDIKLSPTKKDIFGGDQWFFGDVEMVRDKQNNVVGCKVSNGRVRNLKFKKLECEY